MDGESSTKIRITAIPKSNDVVPVRNQILEVDLVNTTTGGNVDISSNYRCWIHCIINRYNFNYNCINAFIYTNKFGILDEWQKTIQKLLTKVSPLIEGQVPDFVQSDHPKFVKFLKHYYQYLEAGRITYTGELIM